MTLEVSQAYGQDFNTLVACPACGYEFDPDERRHVHLSDHQPEDFGLTSIGETDEAAQKPLWGGEDLDCIPDLEEWFE